MTKTIYRIEDLMTANGPYNHKNYERPERDVIMINDVVFADGLHHRPTPQFDGLDAPDKDEYCGFIDEFQMYDWFPMDQICTLLACGFGIFVYQVSDEYVTEGGHQVIFYKELADSRYRLM